MGENLIRRFLTKRVRVSVASAMVPEGTRVYAIGDIHGRLDLLQKLHQMITADAKEGSRGIRLIVVYLGDYIDRGLKSREVIDFLLDNPLEEFESIYLKGNHEEKLVQFLDGIDVGPAWLWYGGDTTLYSYGIPIPKGTVTKEQLKLLQSDLRDALPERHRTFISRLELTKEIGDFLFVHAGINPFESLKNQTTEDLLWIREEFLETEANFGKVVVHGHSVTDAPDIRENRIGIDTGAYVSNKLTCLVLEGSDKRFIVARPGS